MVIGILVSGLLGFPLATESRWRFLFAVTPLLCLAQVWSLVISEDEYVYMSLLLFKATPLLSLVDGGECACLL